MTKLLWTTVLALTVAVGCGGMEADEEFEEFGDESLASVESAAVQPVYKTCPTNWSQTWVSPVSPGCYQCCGYVNKTYACVVSPECYGWKLGIVRGVSVQSCSVYYDWGYATWLWRCIFVDGSWCKYYYTSPTTEVACSN